MPSLLTNISPCNAPSPPTDCADMLGCALRRQLSCLLVMALLLVSAITFSTNDIPNFKPDCKTTSVQKNPSASTVAIVRCPSVPTTEIDTTSAADCPALPTPSTPPVETFPLANISRAPPEFRFSSSV